jgi:hypothetical protein
VLTGKQLTGATGGPVQSDSEWIPLPVYLDLKGCSRSQVYRRLDIKSRKVRGRVEIHRSALAVEFRGSAA